jgi:hypothetical protein
MPESQCSAIVVGRLGHQLRGPDQRLYKKVSGNEQFDHFAGAGKVITIRPKTCPVDHFAGVGNMVQTPIFPGTHR